MKVCLASPSSRKFLKEEFKFCKYFLESFYSMEEWLIPTIKQCEFFMLDSGAFTFMNNNKKNTNFDEYLKQYIKFINDNDIKYFFELDIDSIVGIKKVEELRNKLETGTGKKCIPVWHKSRGKEYFINLCKEYDYVAIGGIVTKEIKPNEYKYFQWFIDVAHKNNCKIHGLGFTNLKGLKKYKFDSVDSTNWTSGGRFGTLYWFNGRDLEQIYTMGRRRRNDISTNKINRHNYYEWVKYQKYMNEKY